MNATSSRAHTVVTVTFDQISKNESGQETKKSSTINLVDLAGKINIYLRLLSNVVFSARTCTQESFVFGHVRRQVVVC